jgi:hypothetical protein
MLRQDGNPSALVCALRAVKSEVLDFRFNYPLQVDDAAGPRESLHYYLYSDGLSWAHMRMDPQGIPRTWGEQLASNIGPAT